MSPLFLFLNASVVWTVIAGLLVWLLRSKTLLLVILVAPLVISHSFREVAGVPELMNAYTTSLIYGFPGIVLGAIYADYKRSMMMLKRMSSVVS